METSGELELINRARAGSVDAFEQLVFRYQDRLYRFLAARAGNRADAEDALQETFVSAYKYLASYRPKYQFSTWLFTIALRKLGGVRSRSRVEHTELPEQLRCEQPGPEQLGSRAESRESLWTLARACLNESQFTALWFFYVEDMSLAEIAKALKRPVSWVKVNLLRARRRLLSELQQAPNQTTIPAGEMNYERT